MYGAHRARFIPDQNTKFIGQLGLQDGFYFFSQVETAIATEICCRFDILMPGAVSIKHFNRVRDMGRI